MENLIIAINCVLPVFLTICTGALIRRSQKVPEQTFTAISNISFRYLLPCTLFHSIYTTDLDTAFDLPLITYLVVTLLILYGAAFFLCRKLVPDHRARGAWIQTVFRSNLAIVGVSMADSMMGSAGVAAMSVVIAIIVPIYNVLAVITLETCRGGTVHLRPTLIGIAKNPLIPACLLGILFLVSGIRIPGSVLKAVDQLGTAGKVMTLVALGASFRLSGVRKNGKKIVLANLLRLIVTPMISLAGAMLLGFRGLALGVVLLSTGPSLAATSYSMAVAMDSDHELTGQIVVTTSFFCCISMFLWIFLLRQSGLLV